MARLAVWLIVSFWTPRRSVVGPAVRELQQLDAYLEDLVTIDREPLGSETIPKEISANRVLRSAIRLAGALDGSHIHWFWEQPQTSLQWYVPELRRRLAKRSSFKTVFDWCRFGKPYRKTTTICGRSDALTKIGLRCQCSAPHAVLQGAAGGKYGQVRMTHVAGEYGARWCAAIASAISSHYH